MRAYGWIGVLALGCAGQAPRVPSLDVTPTSVLDGDPIEISVRGLAPGDEVTIEAERAWGWGQWKKLHRAEARFRADAEGEVRLADHTPVSGSWTDADALGPFWSMAPTLEPVAADRATSTVIIRARLATPASVTLSDTLEIRRGHDDLVETELGPDHPGAFLLHPPSATALPIVVVLGGSEGHDWSARTIAPKLASRGFAVVGFPYFSPSAYGGPPLFEALPRAYSEIELDRIERVLDVLGNVDEVDTDRVALWGMSKGAEMALALAARLDRFAAVAALSPSLFVWEGFEGVGDAALPSATSSYTWRDEPLPYVPVELLLSRVRAEGIEPPLLMAKATRAAREQNADAFASARIDVESIAAPVFLVGGGRDEMCDCGGMAREIAAAREARGLPTELVYSESASHTVAGTPYGPMSAADAHLRAQAFPALVEFFRIHLGSERPPD